MGGSSTSKIYVANAYEEIIHVKIDEEEFYITSEDTEVAVDAEGGGGSGGKEGAKGHGKASVKYKHAYTGHWREIKSGFNRIPPRGELCFELACGKGFCYISIETDSGIKFYNNLERESGCFYLILSKTGELLDGVEDNHWKDKNGKSH